MKRRSVQHDPIATGERDRGAVVVQQAFTLDIEQAVPVQPKKKVALEAKPAKS